MLGRSSSSIIKSSSMSLSPTLSLWWTLWMWRSLSDFCANVLLQIPQVLFSLAAALLTLTWEHDFRCFKMFCLDFEVVLQPIIGQEYKFVDRSWGILRIAGLLSSKWPLILSCLFLLNFVENCFWQVWLGQIKRIFTRSFEVEKKAKTGFVYIVILIMRNWRQCIGSAMRWHLFIFSSFSMRVFIGITCFLWWSIYFFYACFTTKFLFQEKLWPLNISLVMSNLVKCEPSMIWNSKF